MLQFHQMVNTPPPKPGSSPRSSRAGSHGSFGALQPLKEDETNVSNSGSYILSGAFFSHTSFDIPADSFTSLKSI